VTFYFKSKQPVDSNRLKRELQQMIYARGMPSAKAAGHHPSRLDMIRAIVQPTIELHHPYKHTHKHNARVSSHGHLAHVPSQAKLRSMIELWAKSIA